MCSWGVGTEAQRHPGGVADVGSPPQEPAQGGPARIALPTDCTPPAARHAHKQRPCCPPQEPAGAEPERAVPLEMLALGDFEPQYRAPLDVRGGELPVRVRRSFRSSVACSSLHGSVPLFQPVSMTECS